MIQKIKSFVWSKKFLINLVVLGIVYVVIVGGTVWYLDSYTRHGEKVDVPDLIGKNVNNVAGLLNETGLKYEVLDSIYEPSKIEGTVLSQDPLSTKATSVAVKSGRTIRLRVSKRSRLVEVPKCVDKSQRFAESLLTNIGFKFKVEYKTTTEADGAVMDQLFQGKTIKEKTKIPIGSTIVLIVGRNLGGEAVELPDLVGLTILEAKDRLAAMNSLQLLPVCNNCVSSQDSLTAIIESQTPAYTEGAFTASGSTVTVFAKKQEQ